MALTRAQDPRIADAAPRVAAKRAELGKTFEPHVHPDAPHTFFSLFTFFNNSRRSCHGDSARDAWTR